MRIIGDRLLATILVMVLGVTLIAMVLAHRAHRARLAGPPAAAVSASQHLQAP